MVEAASSHQPVGVPVEEQTMAKPAQEYKGAYVTLKRLSSEHYEELWLQIQNDPNLWTYMLDGPYDTQAAFNVAMGKRSAQSETQFVYVILDHRTSKAVGFLALFRADFDHRSVELGHVLFTRVLQRTRGATEASYLMMYAAFNDMHARRLEWKCNSLNAPSKKAAERLGFTFEGTFRQHYIIKGRNRDSCWYSILDGEWPVVGRALRAWMNEDNFDQQGVQRRSLLQLRQDV